MPPILDDITVSNRAVTNKNDYIKCLARYLSCVSSAQSTFKGVQWRYESFVTSILCVLTQIRKLQGGKFSLNLHLYC